MQGLLYDLRHPLLRSVGHSVRRGHWGVVLNVDGGSWQELDYIEVRTTEQRDKHTRGDDEMTGTLQSMPTSEREVQGLYKVCTGMGV
jgi:hypothetical protein